MIQLISPAGTNRPRTMAKVTRGSKADLRAKREISKSVPWEDRAGSFVLLFVRVQKVCVRGTSKGGEREGGEGCRSVLNTSCHPEEPSRQCRLLRGRVISSRSRGPIGNNFLFHEESCRFFEKTTRQTDRSACMRHAIPRGC